WCGTCLERRVRSWFDPFNRTDLRITTQISGLHRLQYCDCRLSARADLQPVESLSGLASVGRMPARAHRRVDRVIQILETVSRAPNHRMRRRHVKPRVGNRISKRRLGPAKRLAAGGACVAFGIDAGMLPHYENWREFPVMVS